ncbi:TRAP transporter small permease [Sporomusa malonica]|uniref:TRAP-type C4-dicarboxylate transport system, small permease component n=1 Tax=Sporomusa malonica TaxID=112901 RepID=A0A1W2CNT6_9FIRM|nr:TRAP transporter small permease [Sporomusa malonica]SMC86870.1 TRAP-type C4-dicarboxylate transport system, small permease component [Sporomusa malonica]
MEALRKIALAIDTLFESIALLGLTSMILIVITQVMTRKLFNFVFFWSEEMTLLLLVWFAFMGMAIGFREDLHLGVDSFTAFLPDMVNRVLDKIIGLSIFAFGVYLIVYGWEFTVMMHESTLAATKLPNSVLYVVMPVTGVMTCAYSALQVAGFDTKRHKGNEVEMSGAMGGEE